MGFSQESGSDEYQKHRQSAFNVAEAELRGSRAETDDRRHLPQALFDNRAKSSRYHIIPVF
jgi:hypothetical protein